MRERIERPVRFPRTMEEAFGCGPHNRGGIWEEPPRMDRADKIVVAGCIGALAAVALLTLFGVIR